MVSNLDYAETILEMAGVKVPEDMQGRSMVSILKGHTPSDWRKEHYYHYYEYPAVHMVKRHYGISTERYKLIHYYYDIDEWELFDLKNDPMEMKNVYDDPSYVTVRKNLHERLEKIRVTFNDNDELTKSFLPIKKE
jgi:arylsulfatase A-like enzyme